MGKYLYVAAVVVMGLGLSLVAGGFSSRPVSTPASLNLVAPPGATLAGVKPSPSDTLLLSYAADPDTLNLLTSCDTSSAMFLHLVYESLAARSLDDPARLVPRLAESWEYDAETLTYTIHLRKGVQWHPMRLPDGTQLPARELTARDVKFTFDCILNPHIEAGPMRAEFEDLEAAEASQRYKIKVEQVDRYTIKIRWTKPYFLSEESTLLVDILPRHVYSVDEHGDLISLDFSSREFAQGFNNHWANSRMCGTGPMMFEEWRHSERFVLAHNPDYWDEPFYFNRLVFTYESNENTLVQKLLQGELDWAEISQKDLYFQNRNHPNVAAGLVELREYQYPGYQFLGYNLRRPFLSEKTVRHAIAHAVPVQKIIDQVIKGMAVRTTGPFQPGSVAYDSTIEPVPFNLEDARRLLESAGWYDTDHNGVRDKHIGGRSVEAKFDLLICSDSPQDLTVAKIIQSNCRKIGVRVNITPANWALMLQRMRTKSFDAHLSGWSLSWRADPFQTWHSSQADLADTSNSIGYKNPEVDRLIDQLHVTFDESRQREVYHKIHRLIFDDQPYTFLYVEKQVAGQNARIQNVKFYRSKPCIDLRQWYASEPR